MALPLYEFSGIVGLSLGVSVAATLAAVAISLPLGTTLALYPFPGRRAIVVLVNAFFGLPPVVVGLGLYLALSHSGPLGFLDLLFTPTAMVIAQTLLAVPIITALAHGASERAGARYGDELISAGASRRQAIPQILMIIRPEILTATLAGFGRTISEVGAVILVGGNIRGASSNHDDGHCASNKPGRSAVGPGAWRRAGRYQCVGQRNGLCVGRKGPNRGG